MSIVSGRIIQSISGFYYVEAADAVIECKAKGSFRKQNIVPTVGDVVTVELSGDKGTVVDIAERKNFLIRPPVANIDILFIVSSVSQPRPNLYVIDKMSALAHYHKIEPVIVFSKSDIADVSPYLEIYKKTSMKVISCSAKTNEGIDEIKELLSKKICALSGNSGVGKSSLLNVLAPGLKLETNEISDKLGRGKHTTRSVSLYKINDGYIADTPGFSSVDLENSSDRIYKEELADCFPEFADFVDDCRFASSCSHINDKGCGVVKAVDDGIIAPQRHESYIRMFEEVKHLKKWN